PCRWPFGDPKKPSFHFCGAPIARGAYCAAHHARAYKVVAADGEMAR
ncbi:MAG: GcrA cell cycle regulator, partial [Caulobacteraceae bacterium]|nr:GcrA cell cycle regulator [Caulobacteraceae bacterium]